MTGGTAAALSISLRERNTGGGDCGAAAAGGDISIGVSGSGVLSCIGTGSFVVSAGAITSVAVSAAAGTTSAVTGSSCCGTTIGAAGAASRGDSCGAGAGGRFTGVLGSTRSASADSDSASTGLSDGSAASGVCHWNASRRPETGDTGRQRSET